MTRRCTLVSCPASDAQVALLIVNGAGGDKERHHASTSLFLSRNPTLCGCGSNVDVGGTTQAGDRASNVDHGGAGAAHWCIS